jgi:hypothetical protein
VLVQLMRRFRSWVMLHRELIRTRIDRFIKAMIALVGTLYRIGSKIAGVLAEVIDALGGIEKVARMAAWAIGLFIGAQVLSAVGSLALGLLQLIRVIGTLGRVALSANLKAMAIPLLIGAAVAAVILIIQDLVSYFQGKKSVTAKMVEAFQRHLPRIKAILLRTFDEALSWIRQAFGQSVDWIMEKLQPLMDAIESVKQWWQTAGSKITGAMDTLDRFLGFSPATAPASGSRVSRSQDVRVNAPVTVTVPEGTPPEAVGRAVQKGVADGLARMLRDTALALEPMVEH